jgi:carbon monoxide dehydrogenase subunit G
MKVSVEVNINANRADVWNVITDIENSINVISSINKIEMIDNPQNSLEGLKWKETRTMFGKEATETMWITESEENEYYHTRAESHGSVYITKLSLNESDSLTKLTMSFEGVPQTATAKLLSFLMSPMIKSSMKKAIAKDLGDIKKHLET